jgi:hypothetical protein
MWFAPAEERFAPADGPFLRVSGRKKDPKGFSKPLGSLPGGGNDLDLD